MDIKNSVIRLTSKSNTSRTGSVKILSKKLKDSDLNDILVRIELKRSKLYKIGWAYLQNHHDIEDVFQVTIIQIYENIQKLKEEKYFDTWMTAIFINECKRILKLKKKKRFICNVELLENSHIDDNSLILKEALKKLDEIHREVIVLKYISGYSQEEISNILEIPMGTVKSRLYRGLRILREKISKEGK